MVLRINSLHGQKPVTADETQGLAEQAVAAADKKPSATRTFGTVRVGTVKPVLDAWVASEPWEPTRKLKLGTIKPTLGLANTEPKAYWKFFSTEQDFFEQVLFEADERVLKNRDTERQLANELLKHQPTAAILNDLRRAIGAHFWKNDGIAGKASYYLTTNPVANLLPNWTGSYNEANSYPAHERSKQLDYPAPAPADLRNATAFAMNWILQPIMDYATGSRDRLSLSFDKRDFNVAQNVAILHDIKELFSPRGNSRAFPTFHTQIVPHPYQGATSPERPKRWNNHGRERIAVLRKDLSPYAGAPHNAAEEIAWDQGRKLPGTRLESSPDTKTAREKFMPIETGRSHTAARLFEMVSLLKPASTASAKEQRLFTSRIEAMAYGIFGYWNADEQSGGYPKSLTPVHTYHEVMDPAEDYQKDVYKSPFDYEDLKAYLRRPAPRT